MISIFEKNRPVIAAGILYTITALVVVISAWIERLHRFELDLTISIYTGLRHWTTYLYMGIAVIMVSQVIVYLKRSNMHNYFAYILMFLVSISICPNLKIRL